MNPDNKDAEYILLRKSITKEIIRHKNELEKKMKRKIREIEEIYEFKFSKLEENYKIALNHLLIKRDNENKFIEQADKMKNIIKGLQGYVE